MCVTDGKEVVLENERLSMTINKAKGQISSLHYNSHTEPSIKSTNLLKGGSGYYLGNVGVNDKGLVVGPDVADMKITQNVLNKIFLLRWLIYLGFHLLG